MYVTTIPQRYRRTGEQTTCLGNIALCAASCVKTDDKTNHMLTFYVRLLYSQFGYVPFVAVRSIDGASVGVAEIDKCAFDVCGQRLDASTA